MKILWLTEFFPATGIGEITGGVEARCFFVSKYLRDQGHQVKILARQTTGGVWHPPSLLSVPDRIIFTVKTIVAGLQADFDIIEGTNSATYLIALSVSLIRNKPVVYWYPDVFLGQWVKIAGPVGLLGEISDWLVLHFPKGTFLAISEQTKAKLVACGVKPDRIKVIYCGYDDEEIRHC